MISILNPQDYVDYVKGVVSRPDAVVNGTHERFNEQFQFHGRMDNLVFGPVEYSEAVWEGIDAYLKDDEPDDEVTGIIEAYFDAGEGWFSPQAVEEYAQQFVSGVFDVVDKIEADPWTRKATIRLRDDSCMMSVQFMLRDEVFYTTASFRSIDLVKGLPVDVYVLQRLASTVLEGLKISVNTSRQLVLNVASAHIYDQDIKRVTAK